MYKGSKSIAVFVLMIMLCIISCATLSPYYNNSGGYSLLGAAIPTDGTLSVFLKKSLIKDSVDIIPSELINRAEILTLAINDSSSVYGALEGRFVADSIRYATGKNKIEYNSLTVMQPDSGILIFSNGDIKQAESTLIGSRKIYRSKEEMRNIFLNDGSVCGSNISSAVISQLFSVDVPVNKIKLALNRGKDSDINLSGTIVCYSKEDAKTLSSAIKTWIISRYRINAKTQEVKRLYNALNVNGETIRFNDVCILYSDFKAALVF